MEKEKEAFQDLIGPENHCHGCGCANEKGLQIKSYWDGDSDESVMTYMPQPHQCAGLPQVMHGGVLGSLIDCHGNNLAMALAYHRDGRKVGSHPLIWYVTARLKIDFVGPVFMDKEITVRAKMIKNEGKKSWIECQLFQGENLCCQSELLQIKIDR